MFTEYIEITGDSENDKAAIARAAEIVCNGGLVAFPTETVYGLGADTLNANAVQKIFEAKERPAWDPLIVHGDSVEMLKRVIKAEPRHLEALIKRFMPGALTVVVEKADRVPEIVTAGRQTVAVRIPAHPVALELIRACRTPIAAPSANRFGKLSPTTAAHVLQDLDGRIDAVLDAGPTQIGVESTVLDLTTEPPTLLRPGDITKEQLEEVIGEIQVYRPHLVDTDAGLPSPGLSVRHYAPRARLVPVEPTLESLQNAVETWLQTNKQIGIMLPNGWNTSNLEIQTVNYNWGEWGNWQILAQRLFSGLRWLDTQGVEVILVPLPPDEGLARAIRDRILRASQPE
jgi:L-threonylcarbamoyladenylate synthase